MKETKKSIRVWFGIMGLLPILFTIIAFKAINNTNTFGMLGILVGLIPSFAYLYFVVKFNHYLATSPKILINFLIILIIFDVVLFFLAKGDIFSLLINVIINWYLIRNIKRLSKNEPQLK